METVKLREGIVSVFERALWGTTVREVEGAGSWKGVLRIELERARPP